VQHDAHGYWLREAGGAEPVTPATGDLEADVVVLGGGYTGMWTAWQLLERAPDTRVVVLEADVCGHGPSGRNGGFCETLWSNLPSLIERFGDERALAACAASSDSVRAIGAWCEAEGVDAWFKQAGFVMTSTSAAQDAVVDGVLDAAGAVGALGSRVIALDGAAVRARCDSPRFRAGLLVPDDATVQPARLGLGLRRRLLERGVAIH
jgi:glycine/D-amino acid oxidase-like deaminating enzyme